MNRKLRTIALVAAVCMIAFLLAIRLSAQTPAKPAATPAPKAEAIKLPPARTEQLKQIQLRQNVLQQEFQALEVQKVIVAQRAALELHLTAEQVDTMELTAMGDSYAFTPKPSPSPTPTPEKPK